MAIIRKRKWFIIITLLVCVILSVTATWLWLRLGPLWSADVLVEVESPVANTGMIRTQASEDIMKRLLQSNVRKVTASDILEKAIGSTEFRGTKWYIEHKDSPIKDLGKVISASAIPGTNLMIISMTGQDREELPVIVQAVADAFVDHSKTITWKDNTTNIEKRSDERAHWQTELERVRTQMNRERPLDTGSVEKEAMILSQGLEDSNRQMKDLAGKARDAMVNLKTIEDQSPVDQAHMSNVLKYVDEDPDLRSLKVELINTETARDGALKTFGPAHKQVQQLEARLTSLRQQAADREAAAVRDGISRVKEYWRGTVDSFKGQMVELQQTIDREQASFRDLHTRDENIRNLQGEEKSIQEKLDKLDVELMEGRLLITETPVKVFNRARLPLEPYMPQWKIMIAGGVVLGLMLGFGLSFLLEFMDSSVKTPNDISRKMDLPVLGIIPHVDDLEEEFQDVRLAFASNPHSLMSEAFRQIRSCLQFSGPASQRRTLLVTSSLPEDGRTTVALNLAASIARTGRKVLVVDTNVRQPQIAKLFPACPKPGISSVLVGQANWREQVCQVEPNMFVMASGPLPPNPAELLGSDQMRSLITELAANYDQVIFDGAPCLVVTDGSVLATMVDAVILVVRAGANTHGIVQRTRDMLTRVGAHVVGVALNGIRVTAGGYLKKSYDAFYDYREPSPQLPPGPPTVKK
jgi:capsular exopolysaccharide synthesis family protein